MKANIPFIMTRSGLTIMLDGKTNSIGQDAVNYNSVVAALKAGDEKALRAAINVRANIVSKSNGLVEFKNGGLYYKGEPLHSALASRILEMLRQGFDVKPLVAFLENLMANPSKRAVDELYGFLEACNLPVTADGHFLAYKRVRNDYKDIHSGKFDNSVGKVLEMPRNAVCDDKEQTCSYGLHFCSESYLPHFGAGGGSRVVIVKINPADVVSIPVDYKNAKGRTCRYEVVDELSLDESELLINKLPADYTNQYSNTDEDADLEYENDEAAEEASDGYDWEESAEDEEWEESAEDEPSVLVNSNAKLTEQDVRDIRSMLEDGMTVAAVAKAFNVSTRTIGRIRDYEAWAWVK